MKPLITSIISVNDVENHTNTMMAELGKRIENLIDFYPETHCPEKVLGGVRLARLFNIALQMGKVA